MSIDLEAIEARANAATPGPWYNLDDWMIHTEPDFEHNGIPNSKVIGTVKKADADFIAHSREDIPALLAEVERQAAEIKTLSDFIEAYTDICDKHQETHHKLMDKIAAITAERDEAVEIGDALCEEVENCYGRETELTQRWHERSRTMAERLTYRPEAPKEADHADS